MTWLEEGRGLVVDHQAQFRALVAHAELAGGRRRPRAAAALAQMASAYAWLNHTGVFTAPGLDDVLRGAAGHLPAAAPVAGAVDVLHVVTQVYATGGPTQAICCWVDQDAGRRHRVVITQQGAAPMPEKLATRVSAGLGLLDLTERGGDLLDRAATLRAVADKADVVVLHTHPHDVVPILAFLDQGQPGLLHVNHADHVYWTGASLPARFLHMRDSGRDLAHERRGIDPARSLLMARPLPTRHRTMSRSEAKRRLGVPMEDLLVVTAADAPKYEPLGERSLLDEVLPVFLSDPRARLLAAGPAPKGEWMRAEEATGGRVRALGRLPEVSVLQQAADVYLDSFPFSSLTSLLETGRFGTPCVTFRGHPPECAVLGADTPGVDEHLARPSSPDQLRASLGALLGDEDARVRVGDATAGAIVSTHTGAGWLASLESTYAAVTSSLAAVPPGGDGAASVSEGSGALDAMVALVQARTPFHAGVADAARMSMQFLPVAARLGQWRRLATTGRPVSPMLLLDERTGAAVTTWRRNLGITRSALRRRAV